MVDIATYEDNDYDDYEDEVSTVDWDNEEDDCWDDGHPIDDTDDED